MYCRFQDDDVTALGAEMAYYLILSFFPFLLFLITLAGYTPITTEDTLENLSQYLPGEVIHIAQIMLAQIASNKSRTLLSFGAAATLWSASSGVCALIRGINKAYEQEETRPFWKVRGIAIIFTFALTLLILLSFLTLIFGHMVGESLFNTLGYSDFFAFAWLIIRYAVSLLTTLFIFTLVYYYIPNHRGSLRHTFPGAMLATLGWFFISIGFSFYVKNFGSYSNAYGSIGGIILMLVWVYWSSLTILIGGELNAAFAFIREGRKKPQCKKYSIPILFHKKSRKKK